MTRVHGYFTKIEVGDPHLIPQSIWENLPPSQKVLLTERELSSQEWAPLDQRRFRIEPENYRSSRISPIAARSGERLLSEPSTAAQP